MKEFIRNSPAYIVVLFVVSLIFTFIASAVNPISNAGAEQQRLTEEVKTKQDLFKLEEEKKEAVFKPALVQPTPGPGPAMGPRLFQTSVEEQPGITQPKQPGWMDRTKGWFRRRSEKK